MIRYIAGEKGQGKTKKLIEMANNTVKTTDGHIVFIDDRGKNIYELSRDIRFIQTQGFPISNYREFVGFICGVLAQDTDIKEIFIDGIAKIIRDLDSEGLVKLTNKLTKLSEENTVDFIISLNWVLADLPEEVKPLTV